MNFNNIIMNPPYNKNLHLKILTEAKKHLAGDGECVCIHPLVWEFQMATKGCTSIPITSFETIDQDIFRKLFALRKEADGCVTFIKNNSTSNKFESPLFILLNKFLSHKSYEKLTQKATKTPTTLYPIRVMFGGSADPYGACLTTAKFESAKKTNLCTNINFINLNNEKEQKNFFNSFSNSICMKFLIYKCNRRNVAPWMGNCINPRTNLKGYESEWMDEDYYNFFGITKDEQKIIESTMEKYK